jgi:hypothetical protein
MLRRKPKFRIKDFDLEQEINISSRRMGEMKPAPEKHPQKLRSAPNSCEFWDARTALPQVCSLRTIKPRAKTVNSTFVPIQ